HIPDLHVYRPISVLLQPRNRLVIVLASITYFFFTHTPTTEIYTLSLHDALPIFLVVGVPGVVDAGVPDRERSGNHRRAQLRAAQIGRAHVLTPVTWPSRMPSSA